MGSSHVNEAHSQAGLTVKLSAEVEDAILTAVRSIRYVSVEVQVHNSVVVQIERKEKMRFAPHSSPKVEKGC